MKGVDRPDYEQHEIGHRTDLPFLPSPQEHPSLPAVQAGEGDYAKGLKKVLAGLEIEAGRRPSADEIRQLKAAPRSAV